MKVTEIRAVAKTKYKVYVDGQFAFVLYKGELSHYHLAAGGELTEEEYQDIRKKVLKRAKLRAMHLLTDMDRTESQLEQKLRDSGYPEDIAREAIDYVKSFGYINDREYARRFIENRKHAKSRRELYALLMQKGLEQTMVLDMLEEFYHSEDTRGAIREVLRKKRFDPETAGEEDCRRMCMALARKGFHCEDIRQVIQNW